MAIFVRVTVFLLQFYRLKKKARIKNQERFSLHVILQPNIVQVILFPYKLEPQKTAINTSTITSLATIN